MAGLYFIRRRRKTTLPTRDPPIGYTNTAPIAHTTGIAPAREHASRNGTDLFIIGYDQAKAFDSAQWIEIVLSMATCKRWHWRECLFALPWMTGQTRQLLINGTLSDPIIVTRGVPQGGVLSPTLYNEHVRTLAQRIDALPESPDPTKRTTRVQITDRLQLSLLLYADDLNTLTTTRGDAIKGYRYGALPWSSDTASKLNSAKTEFIRLTMPNKKINKPAPLKLDATTSIPRRAPAHVRPELHATTHHQQKTYRRCSTRSIASRTS